MQKYFQVDTSRCKRDGICTKACPVNLIIEDVETKLPMMIQDGDKICIQCGHCVAVCPHDALSLTSFNDKIFVKNTFRPQEEYWEDFKHFTQARRSIRIFKDKPVERKELERIIDITRYAPTASHRQPVNWIFVEKKESVMHLTELTISWMQKFREENREAAKERKFPALIAGWKRGKNLISRGAPHMAITWCHNPESWAPVDCSIALTYLELAAHALGVGSCWAGYFCYVARHSVEIKDFLGLTEVDDIEGALLLGYPQFKFHKIPWRKPLPLQWI